MRELKDRTLLSDRAAIFKASKGIILGFKSPIKPTEQLFLPQGVHPTTGQALVPLFNNKESIATGEGIAKNSNIPANPNFAFQVVNTTYTIRGGLIL